MRGLNEHLKICVLRAEVLAKTRLKMQNFLTILMVGAHERRIDGKFRERRQAWKKKKKRSWPRHIPVPLSNMSAPGVFTCIYLKLILLCPYLIDSEAVFWSYYTRFKTNKAKICIHIGLLRPHFCLLCKIFDVTILAKPFVFRSLKHHEILSWPLTCPAMY